MMKLATIVIFIAALFLGSATDISDQNYQEEATVIEILEKNGVDYSDKKPNFNIKGVSAEIGKQIFHKGFASHDGMKAKQQSKHFVCTSCHNYQQEDPDLTINDPQARLEYTADRDMPFLQGTTMYGAVNRKTYYNGDYFKKYGELVYDARNDIRNAIQLCATECAQGRALKDWEMESMLAYLWTLQYKLSDLNLDEAEKNLIMKNDGSTSDTTIVNMLESKYLSGSDATFIPPPTDRKAGNGLQGDAENGKLIYKNSCLHCHYQGRYAYLYLDDHKMSLKYLRGKIPTYHPHSLYQVVRWGIGSHYMNEAYMPNYTEEKLSEQQLADLVAYIKEAKRQ